jgi:hypothetical protein
MLRPQIQAGEPITITYGSHSNAELLLSYGFVLPNNPSDRFVLDYNIELLTVSGSMAHYMSVHHLHSLYSRSAFAVRA